MPQTSDHALSARVALTTGASFWHTQPIAGFAPLMLADGPHGIRAQIASSDHLGIAPSQPATCFPPASGLGQSWDPELAKRVGIALGQEAAFFGVSVLLGPGVNIRRDPRGGRNFEYFSEDPIHGSDLASGWVRGVQSQGVGTSLKHFAANNAETDRMRSDSVIDERALREIYLKSFERVVKGAKPWTVMCSYNKVNGTSASQNPWLLQEILRKDWGFDGAVVSDWGAVYNRVESLRAGLDLEMPSGGDRSVQKVVAALEAGSLDISSLDQAVSNLERLATRVNSKSAEPADFEANHLLAREVAARSIVLLKNQNNVLPLRQDARVAVIGAFATAPRIQGGGSSHVVPTRVDIPLDEIRNRSASGDLVSYSEGFSLAGASDSDALLVEQATKAAAAAEVAVLFLGLSASEESEGFDRTSITLPERQIALLRAVSLVQPNTVVFLSHGGTVLLAEVETLAGAILDGALLGQGGGHAVAAVLFGAVNPSGRLSETVPAKLEDAPSYGNFPGEFSQVLYGESIFVGYRGYDLKDIAVTFPFGFGLSYTQFQYGELGLQKVDSGVRVSIEIRNVGDRAGREVVQFYSGKPDSKVRRAVRELKSFVSVQLEPAESKTIEAVISFEDLKHWDILTSSWVLEGGDWEFYAAASSRDVRSTAQINLPRSGLVPLLTMSSTVFEVLEDPIAGPLLMNLLPKPSSDVDAGEVLGIDLAAIMGSFPISSMVLTQQDHTKEFESLIKAANSARAEIR